MLFKDAKTGEFLTMVSDWEQNEFGMAAWFQAKSNAMFMMVEEDVIFLENGGHELGKAYYIDYWGQYALVTDLQHNNGDWRVTYRWDDGRVGTHFTSLGRKDHEVSLEKYNNACQRKLKGDVNQ